MVADEHYPASLLRHSQRLQATTPMDSCRNWSHTRLFGVREPVPVLSHLQRGCLFHWMTSTVLIHTEGELKYE